MVAGCGKKSAPATNSVRPITYETYENKEAGYSLEYPSNWAFDRVDHEEKGVKSSLIVFGPADMQGTPIGIVQIAIDTMTKSDTLDAYLDRRLKAYQSPVVALKHFKLKSRASSTVAGYSAVEAEWTGSDSGEAKHARDVIIANGDKVLSLHFVGSQTQWSEHMPDFDHMIKTFKFAEGK